MMSIAYNNMLLSPQICHNKKCALTTISCTNNSTIYYTATTGSYQNITYNPFSNLFLHERILQQAPKTAQKPPTLVQLSKFDRSLHSWSNHFITSHFDQVYNTRSCHFHPYSCLQQGNNTQQYNLDYWHSSPWHYIHEQCMHGKSFCHWSTDKILSAFITKCKNCNSNCTVNSSNSLNEYCTEIKLQNVTNKTLFGRYASINIIRQNTAILTVVVSY